jgi:hypothetical protein
MINLKVVVPTPGPLGDDDIQQLDLLAFTMKMSGFAWSLQVAVLRRFR